MSNNHGGRRLGAGRKRGSSAFKTLKRLNISVELAEGGVLPLEVLLQTMRALWAQDTTEAKLQACTIAKEAAPYLHPRLSSVEQNTTLTRRAAELSDDELAAIAAGGSSNGAATPADDPEKLN